MSEQNIKSLEEVNAKYTLEQEKLIVDEGVHPLAVKKSFTPLTWPEWQMLWDKESRYQILDGLLHCGLTLRFGDRTDNIDAISYYLSIADKRRSRNSIPNQRKLIHKDDINVQINNDRICKDDENLSNKAFHVLCDKFFKIGAQRRPDLEDQHDYWYMVLQPKLFNKLLWFFRPSSRYHHYNIGDIQGYDYVDSDQSFYNRTALNFLKNLIRIYWDRIVDDDYLNIACLITKDQREDYKSLKPRIIEIMSEILYLDRLLQYETLLDDNCLEKLKELALIGTYTFPDCSSNYNTRQPVSIEEAAGVGIKAAEILLLLQNKRKQRERFETIKEAVSQKKEIEARLAELNKT